MTARDRALFRKGVGAVVALTAWVIGTVVGTIGGVQPATGTVVLQVGRAHAEHEPALDGSEPIFILVLGSDARPGTPVERGLADSIHILGLNPAKGKATLLGFPRDSYVPLSSGGTNKINAAMPQGGPGAMVTTVERLTGIELDYYMLTGFKGFADTLDDIGGLTIDLPVASGGIHEDVSGGGATAPGPRRAADRADQEVPVERRLRSLGESRAPHDLGADPVPEGVREGRRPAFRVARRRAPQRSRRRCRSGSCRSSPSPR